MDPKLVDGPVQEALERGNPASKDEDDRTEREADEALTDDRLERLRPENAAARHLHQGKDV